MSETNNEPTPPANPQPPYEGSQIPERFRTVAWEELPPGIKQKIRRVG